MSKLTVSQYLEMKNNNGREKTQTKKRNYFWNAFEVRILKFLIKKYTLREFCKVNYRINQVDTNEFDMSAWTFSKFNFNHRIKNKASTFTFREASALKNIQTRHSVYAVRIKAEAVSKETRKKERVKREKKRLKESTKKPPIN